MKRGKKKLAILLVASILAGYLPIDSGMQLVNAEEDIVTTSTDLQQMVSESLTITTEDFVIVDGVLTQYTGSGEEVVIPDGVTSIADGVFNGQSGIVCLELPDTLTALGNSSLRNMSSLSLKLQKIQRATSIHPANTVIIRWRKLFLKHS